MSSVLSLDLPVSSRATEFNVRVLLAKRWNQCMQSIQLWVTCDVDPHKAIMLVSAILVTGDDPRVVCTGVGTLYSLACEWPLTRASLTNEMLETANKMFVRGLQNRILEAFNAG